MLNWWRSLLTGVPKPTARANRRYRPRLEILEDRTTPSTGFVPLQPFSALGVVAADFPHTTGAGDFNGDGKTDLVVANGGTTGTISVLTGKGDGRFNPVGTLGSTNSIALKNTIGGFLTAVAVGDFNNDGISDVAVVETNFGTDASRIHILFGGTGGLNEVSTLNPNSASPILAIAVGDFDANGLPDIAVAESLSNVDFFFNQGGGAFSAPSTIATTQSGAGAIVVGQFNGDTTPDLAIAYDNGTTFNIVTLLGQGSGGGSTHFSLGPTTNVVALNTAFGADMASPFVLGQTALTPFVVVTTVGPMTNTARVLTSNGDGTFNPTAVPAVNLGLTLMQAPNAVVSADFNGDGLPDFATANSNGTISIVQNNGNNSFTLFATPPANPVAFSGNSVDTLTLGRFTNTGKRDIAAVDFNMTTMLSTAGVLQNQFSNAYFAVGTDAGSLTQVNIYDQMGNLLGTFFPFIGTNYMGGARVAVGDVTGDGVPDLIVANGVAPGGLAIIKVYDGAKLLALAKQGFPGGNAESAFIAQVQPYGMAGIGLGDFVAVGNLNGNPNGIDQIIVGADGINGQVSIFSFNTSTNTLVLKQTLVIYNGFTGGIRVASGDVNGDGKDDLITGSGTGTVGQVQIFAGIFDPNLFFNSTPFAVFTGLGVPAGSTYAGGIFVTAGDFDGDGFADICVSAGVGGGPQVQLFPGKVVAAKGSNTTLNDAAGFNNVIVPPGSPYVGGARVGVTQGIYADPENAGSTMLQTVLLSSSGPGGNQYTVFDGYTFVTKLFGTGKSPPQFVGNFVQPTSSTGNTGQFIS